MEIGYVLKEFREKRGIELSEVSRILKIRRQYLSNIENGEWHKIPGKVYLKGYIIQYSKFLAVDDESTRNLLEIIEREYNKPEAYYEEGSAPIITQEEPTTKTKRSFFPKIFPIISFFLIILLAIFVYISNNKKDSDIIKNLLIFESND